MPLFTLPSAMLHFVDFISQQVLCPHGREHCLLRCHEYDVPTPCYNLSESNIHPSVLHPEYKLQYFAVAGWTTQWIAEARGLVTTEWTSHYRGAMVSSSTPSEDVAEPRASDVCVHPPLWLLSSLTCGFVAF